MAPSAQAQMLEMNELPDSKAASDDQSEDAAWGGMASDFVSPESSPILYDKSPFKPTDRSPFHAKTNDFLWTLPVKSISQTNTVDNNMASGQSNCLRFASSSLDPNQDSMAATSVLSATANNFGLALSVDCLLNTEEIVDRLKNVTSLMKIANLQEKIVCLLQDPEAACDSSQIAALKVNQSSEKVPEPTVSAAVWLGVAAVGALSARFRPKSQ